MDRLVAAVPSHADPFLCGLRVRIDQHLMRTAMTSFGPFVCLYENIHDGDSHG